MMTTHTDNANAETKTTSHRTKSVVVAEEVTPVSRPPPAIATIQQIAANNKTEAVENSDIS